MKVVGHNHRSSPVNSESIVHRSYHLCDPEGDQVSPEGSRKSIASLTRDDRLGEALRPWRSASSTEWFAASWSQLAAVPHRLLLRR